MRYYVLCLYLGLVSWTDCVAESSPDKPEGLECKLISLFVSTHRSFPNFIIFFMDITRIFRCVRACAEPKIVSVISTLYMCMYMLWHGYVAVLTICWAGMIFGFSYAEMLVLFWLPKCYLKRYHAIRLLSILLGWEHYSANRKLFCFSMEKHTMGRNEKQQNM